jgi:hypothetical protein
LLVPVLFIPAPDGPSADRPAGDPFEWGRDAPWAELEARFERARARRCGPSEPHIERLATELDAALHRIEHHAPRPPGHRAWNQLEDAVFRLGVHVAACESTRWDMGRKSARDRAYRLLYGGRATLEHALLQRPRPIEPTRAGTAEPSGTPSTVIHGVEVHSGDILVSRGGAPTSALIARGNDYPGNFSHVALLHVSEAGRATVIESLIEHGVVLTSPEEYLEDKKLRIMLLRLRSDIGSRDAALPHRAATSALERAQGRDIPYDFAMDYRDPSKQFCSEVVLTAYTREGIRLWKGLTSMSSAGVARWLASFGVEHFETLGPSDLEYDPKLRVVAEWRDGDALQGDQLDNAVIDAMLEGAERGEPVGVDWLRLPLARAAKAYSVARNVMDGSGPIPEGMTATVALRVESLRRRHEAIRARLERLVRQHEEREGYFPPYWELVALARDAKRTADPL